MTVDDSTRADKQCKILVVDDEEDIRVMLERLLSGKRQFVKVVSSAEGAMREMERSHFDIVLTDIRMPGTGGMDLTSWIKRNTKDTDVIIMTGHASIETATKAVRLGAFDYLLKPFQSVGLVAKTIERAIEKKRLDAELQQMRTEREQSKELQKAYDKLRETQYLLIQTEKMSALGEMAAGVAHELNQPLNNIKIVMQSLLKDIEKDRWDIYDVTSDCRQVVGLVDKMAVIINHIRAFTRKPGIEIKDNIDINCSINNALSLLQEQLRVHDIQLETQLASDLPVVAGDPNNLEQVFLNLLTNARDAVLKRIESHKQPRGKLKIRSFMLIDTKLCVAVEDNGTGVASEIRHKIFDPFFTTKEVGKGTGLGLSIAQRIVTEYGGRITVEGQKGAGTNFKVILPVLNHEMQ